jgi:excisionase family DNA binding protein
MTFETDTVMSVADVAAVLKAGRSTVYELIRQGKIPAKKLGRARGLRIPTKAFYAWLNSPDNVQPSED